MNSSDHGYVGLYNKKRICAIGKLTKTVIAYEENGEVKFLSEGGATVTDDEKKNSRRLSQTPAVFIYFFPLFAFFF